MQHPFSRFLGLLAALVLCVVPVTAQAGFVSDDGLGYYGGSVQRFATLNDALNGTNPLGASSMFPQRDLSLFLGSGASYFGYGDVFSYILTNWYASLVSPNSGLGNPNNTNLGFQQLYDTDGGSTTSMEMYWLSNTTFRVDGSGENTIVGCGAIPPEDCGRMSNGSGAANGGSFIFWEFYMTAYNLSPCVYNPLSGFCESSSRPTNVDGSFRGVFHDNVTGEYLAFENYLNEESWAADNGLAGDPFYAAATTVPEPATMALLATGLAGIGGAGFRRRRKPKNITQ